VYVYHEDVVALIVL